MTKIEERRAKIIAEMERKKENIQYYMFLNNLISRPNDVKAYEKRLRDMSLRATAKVDSCDSTGDALVAGVAEIKAIRYVVRELLSDLVNAEANLDALNKEQAELASELRRLDIPKKTNDVKFRPPKR